MGEEINKKVSPQIGTKRAYSMALIVAFVLVAGTFFLTESYYNSQFTVLYSLDKQENDKAIVSLIDTADRYVYFAIYLFSMDDIAQALVRAKERGVVVWGIMDKEGASTASAAVLETLHSAGIGVETQKHPDGIMHIKAVVTDKGYASGSYNWTGSATKVNHEVLEVGTNRYLHDEYYKILKKILLANE